MTRILAILALSVVTAGAGTNKQVNAVIFDCHGVVAVYIGAPTNPVPTRPAWGEPVLTSGWNRMYFAQLENGDWFFHTDPSEVRGVK